MTPEEKANELVTRYRRFLPMNQTTMLEAKGCALIAVDEIIKQNVSTPTDYGASWTYWMQVKEEIEKL